MNDYLTNLVARSFQRVPVLQPRLPFAFEPLPPVSEPPSELAVAHVVEGFEQPAARSTGDSPNPAAVKLSAQFLRESAAVANSFEQLPPPITVPRSGQRKPPQFPEAEPMTEPSLVTNQVLVAVSSRDAGGQAGALRSTPAPRDNVDVERIALSSKPEPQPPNNLNSEAEEPNAAAGNASRRKLTSLAEADPVVPPCEPIDEPSMIKGGPAQPLSPIHSPQLLEIDSVITRQHSLTALPSSDRGNARHPLSQAAVNQTVLTAVSDPVVRLPQQSAQVKAAAVVGASDVVDGSPAAGCRSLLVQEPGSEAVVALAKSFEPRRSPVQSRTDLLESPTVSPAVTVSSPRVGALSRVPSTVDAKRAGSVDSNATPKLAPSVHVTIGRIEVRAISVPTAAPQKKNRPSQAMALQDYLKQRNGSKR